jgi:hypothetical protein|tara:strand:+ start:2247 stop:2399 length:153 start_codon:yes stop_codon:yes gene_type:complete
VSPSRISLSLKYFSDEVFVKTTTSPSLSVPFEMKPNSNELLLSSVRGITS